MRKLLTMTGLLLITSAFLMTGLFAFEPNDILGDWYLPEDSDGRISVARFYKDGDVYNAYGYAYKDPTHTPALDENNPDKALRTLPMTGLVVVWNLKADKNGWKDGKIYNPENGKTYNIKASLDNNGNTLKLKVQVPFGPTKEWTRAPAGLYNGLPANEIRNPW